MIIRNWSKNTIVFGLSYYALKDALELIENAGGGIVKSYPLDKEIK